MAAPHFLPAPGGLVPDVGEGGRCWSLVYSDGDGGPDCVLGLWISVCVVVVEDCFLTVLISGPLCKLYRTTEIFMACRGCSQFPKKIRKNAGSLAIFDQLTVFFGLGPDFYGSAGSGLSMSLDPTRSDLWPGICSI